VALEPLLPPAACAAPLPEFLATLETLDEEWRRRVRAARAKGRVLRYLATVTPRSVAVQLSAVDRSDSFGSLHGTDNQIAFTTQRYHARNPLVIKGPGAGLAVTAAGVLNDVLALAARA
jgi:homoserine dehydrogenase